MTIENINTQITKFLSNKKPEVLALKGAWGVGKTYKWNELLLQNTKHIKLTKYCYISLFNTSSIKELKTSILTKTQPILEFKKKNHNQITNSEIKEKLCALFNSTWNTIIDFKNWPNTFYKLMKHFMFGAHKFRKLPYIKNLSITLDEIASNFIFDTIICFDDFERMNNITPQELLGLISELKEEKNCKIVLIFNEEELFNVEQYQKYREKVIDIELQFSPTAAEAAKLILSTDLIFYDLIYKYCISLEINNLRILRKIVTLAKLISPKIQELHPGIHNQTIMSLVLFIWCSYASDKNKPDIEYLKNWNIYTLGSNAATNKENKNWEKILRNYGLLSISTFDLTILEIIKYGYLEETGFFEESKKLDESLKKQELAYLINDSWRLFNNSFEHNESELLNSMSANLKTAVQYISPLTLNNIIVLFKELGKVDEANKLIDYYVEKNSGDENLFNLKESSFNKNINDPTIIERFEREYSKSLKNKMNLKDAVYEIIKNKSWGEKHSQCLKLATKDDFVKLFKSTHDYELKEIINICLQFTRNKDGKYNPCQNNAHAALVQIGKECPLNAIRIKSFGILIE